MGATAVAARRGRSRASRRAHARARRGDRRHAARHGLWAGGRTADGRRTGERGAPGRRSPRRGRRRRRADRRGKRRWHDDRGHARLAMLAISRLAACRSREHHRARVRDLRGAGGRSRAALELHRTKPHRRRPLVCARRRRGRSDEVRPCPSALRNPARPPGPRGTRSRHLARFPRHPRADRRRCSDGARRDGRPRRSVRGGRLAEPASIGGRRSSQRA